MFAYRATRGGGPDQTLVEVAFTDSSTDLQGLRPDFPALLSALEAEVGVRLARLSQVHSDEVLVVDAPMALGQVPNGDALVTLTRGLGLMIRVADCVPVALADVEAGVIGAVHAGRPGMALDVVTRAVERMRAEGATRITAWIGPHVCGECYEVPDEMRAEVAAVVPEAWSTTRWGTPALDIGAGVRAQLETAGVDVEAVGGCTLEETRFHSFRREGAAAGRMAGLVWMP